jgi:site-specific DNA-methyltransferase (adenine-specific)
VDKAAGAEREIVKQRGNFGGWKNGEWRDGIRWKSTPETAPATELARTWAGHRYGGQALKPAIETVLVFQKPYSGKPVDSITATGAGALWVDGGRIGVDSVPSNRWTDNAHPFGNGAGNEYETVYSNGRWPANFYLTHSPACADDTCAPGCPVAAIGEQSGESVSIAGIANTEPTEADSKIYGFAKYPAMHKSGAHFGDSGTAARFFLNADWNAETWERLETSDPVLYTAKAGRGERDEGLNGMDYKQGGGMQGTYDQKLLTGNGNIRNNLMRNPHATVKPIALTRWLATLLLPPAAYAPRRLLVPFAGVASEMIGAHLAGWEEVVGIELDPDHVDIGRARLDWWTRQTAFNLE